MAKKCKVCPKGNQVCKLCTVLTRHYSVFKIKGQIQGWYIPTVSIMFSSLWISGRAYDYQFSTFDTCRFSILPKLKFTLEGISQAMHWQQTTVVNFKEDKSHTNLVSYFGQTSCVMNRHYSTIITNLKLSFIFFSGNLHTEKNMSFRNFFWYF